MKSVYRKLLMVLLAIVLVPIAGNSDEPILEADALNGYFSRLGNDGTPGSTTGRSLYIKFYPDQWVILLYIPFPYSKSVTPQTVHQTFAEIRTKVSGSAFLKSTFGLLDEVATANVERYQLVNGRVLFNCGNGGTCATEFDDGNVQIVKQGILGEHIIKYLHVRE